MCVYIYVCMYIYMCVLDLIDRERIPWLPPKQAIMINVYVATQCDCKTSNNMTNEIEINTND